MSQANFKVDVLLYVNVDDSESQGLVQISVSEGTFDDQVLSLQERNIVAEHVAIALSKVHQIREYHERKRAEANAALRERSEAGDDVPEIDLPPSGGNKVGLC